MHEVFRQFRHTVTRYKTSTAINLFGLSAAFAVFLIVMMQVRYDLTYDRSYARAPEIYRFGSVEWGTINQQWPQLFTRAFPEIEACAQTNEYYNTHAFCRREVGTLSAETFQVVVAPASDGFLQVFTPVILQGDTTDLLRTPGKALIPASYARQIFGKESPVGQTLYLSADSQIPEGVDIPDELVVAAVYKDFPDNATIKNHLYTYMAPAHEGEWSFDSYMLIPSRQTEGLIDKFQQLLVEKKVANFQMQEGVDALQLTPFSRHYLTTPGQGGSRVIHTTLSLLAIGIIILLIAFINFFNFMLAMAPVRRKNTQIRLILGASRRSLRMILAMESLLLSALSILLATGWIYLFRKWPAASLFQIDWEVARQGIFWGSCAVILLLSFGVGWLGGWNAGKRGRNTQNGLIVVQLTAALVLIVLSGMIKIQHRYMLNRSLGFEQEHILYYSHTGASVSQEAFAEELKRIPGVRDVAGVRNIPGEVFIQWGRTFHGKENVNFFVWPVSWNLIELLGIRLVAGEAPRKAAPALPHTFYFNETFLRTYGLDQSIVGTTDYGMYTAGIIEDFHFDRLHEPIRPLGIWITESHRTSLLVKLAPGDPTATLRAIESLWNGVSKRPFHYRFLEESMHNYYTRESNMARMIGLFGLITVLIAVMGIYGMILFQTRQRTKEIAIRKVNGASVGEIVWMLNRGMALLLAIAFVLSLPVSLYVIYGWLGNFAYRASVPYWLFPLAGALILVVSAAAVSWQSRRAAGANPADAVKTE